MTALFYKATSIALFSMRKQNSINRHSNLKEILSKINLLRSNPQKATEAYMFLKKLAENLKLFKNDAFQINNGSSQLRAGKMWDCWVLVDNI